MTDIKSWKSYTDDINKQLESIIYSLKTVEDFDNLVQPYVKKGYLGLTILNHPYVSEYEYGKKYINSPYRKYILYIQNITINKYTLIIKKDGIVLASQKLLGYDLTYYKSKNNITHEIDELKKQNQHLLKLIEEIYYAPGMPGFVKANISYEKTRRRLSL